MTNSKDNQRDNIFEILDGIMLQLSRTKKNVHDYDNHCSNTSSSCNSCYN